MSISKEDLEKAIAGGKTLAKIAREHNISRQRVSELAKNYDLKVPQFNYSNEQRTENTKSYSIRIPEKTYNILKEKGMTWVRTQLIELGNNIEKEAKK